MSRGFVLILLCLGVLATALTASAQNASLTGQVTDPEGAAVQGADVHVINKDTQAVLQAQTDAAGKFTVPDLPPGHYRVEVQAPGFTQEVNDDVVLAADQMLTYNRQLKIESVKSEVGVEAGGAAQVETESAQVSGTITQKEVVSYGLNGRNFTQLIALAPGVSNQTGQDEAKVGVVGSVKYSVNGGRVEYNTFEVDGDDVLNTGLNGAASTLTVYPSLDAIQEVKVLTSNYGAQFGRTASGTVMVTTKSGSAQLHGNVYEFLRNEAFNARNYFDQTTSAPLYRRNDFGGTIGGPLTIPHVYNTNRDKTFFFFSDEARLEKTPTEYNQAVPSLKERGLIQTPQGIIQPNLVPTNDGTGRIKRSFDFTDVCPLPGSNDANGFQRAQYPDCPASSVNFVTNILSPFPNNDLEGVSNASGPAGSGVDKNALAMLSSNLIPLPNSPTGCSFRIINLDPTDPNHCYDATVSPSTYWREELFRIDHNFTPGIRATFRYIHDSWNTTVLTPQWGAVRNTFPTVQNSFVGPGTSLVARITSAISPTLLNEFVVDYTNSTITLTDKNGPGGAQFKRNPLLDRPLVTDPSAPGQCNPLVSVDPTTGLPQCAMGYIFNNGFGGKMPGLVFAGTNAEYGGEGFAVDPSYMPWDHTNPTYAARDDVSKTLGKHTLQIGAQAVYSQRNQTNNAIGAATGDVQGLLTFSNLTNSSGNAFADFLLTPGNNIQSFTQDSSQRKYYQRYEIVEPYVQDDWRVNGHLTVNLGLRISLFGTYHENNLNAWNFVPSQFDRSAFSVDPVTGILLDSKKSPILINSQNQLPANMISQLGLVQCGVNRVPDGCMTGHLFNPAPRVGFAWDPHGNGKMAIRGGYGIFFEHGTGNEANTGSLEASPPLVLNMTQHFPHGYDCIGRIGYGPAFDPTNSNCQNPNTAGTPVPHAAYPINVTSIPTHAVWPYAQQWSFTIERQLPKDFVATVGYVGSKGTNLTIAVQSNQLVPLPAAENPFGLNEPLTLADCAGGGSLQNNSPFSLQNGTIVGIHDPAYVYLQAACSSPLTPDVNALPGRPYPGLGKIFSLENVANSSYHALQATLRRTRGPLSLGVSYSYSHSLDNSSDRSDPVLVNSYDLRENRASSNFDERHLLNISYVYQLPALQWLRKLRDIAWEPEQVDPNSLPKDNLDIVSKVFGDWELSGITIFQSGVPFTVINSAGNTGISLTDNAGVSSGLGIAESYPDVVRGLPQPPNNSQSVGPLLGNPAQFVAPRGLTFGDAGRNFLNNPSRLNFDVALLKHIRIRESSQLEFRAEAFNVFNHTQFRIWDPDNPGSSGNNVVSCYAGPQYSAGFQSFGGADCVTGAAFLHPIDAHRPRTLQLGLKLSF